MLPQNIATATVGYGKGCQLLDYIIHHQLPSLANNDNISSLKKVLEDKYKELREEKMKLRFNTLNPKGEVILLGKDPYKNNQPIEEFLTKVGYIYIPHSIPLLPTVIISNFHIQNIDIECIYLRYNLI